MVFMLPVITHGQLDTVTRSVKLVHNGFQGCGVFHLRTYRLNDALDKQVDLVGGDHPRADFGTWLAVAPVTEPGRRHDSISHRRASHLASEDGGHKSHRRCTVTGRPSRPLGKSKRSATGIARLTRPERSPWSASLIPRCFQPSMHRPVWQRFCCATELRRGACAWSSSGGGAFVSSHV